MTLLLTTTQPPTSATDVFINDRSSGKQKHGQNFVVLMFIPYIPGVYIKNHAQKYWWVLERQVMVIEIWRKPKVLQFYCFINSKTSSSAKFAKDKENYEGI